jgi:hypothetical protein
MAFYRAVFYCCMLLVVARSDTPHGTEVALLLLFYPRILDSIVTVLYLTAFYMAVARADSPHGAEVALLQTGHASGTQNWCT